MKESKNKDVIVALDFKNKEETMEFLGKFDQKKIFVKIGMELFYSEGPELIKEIKKQGHKIFLDLKLHDIPNTVGSAMAVLGKLGVDMCNLHGAGGSLMMKAAKEGLKQGAKEAGLKMPILIAVTQLTSTSKELMQQEILIDREVEEVVLKYGANAKNCELEGVVCSPKEVPLLKKALGDKFLTVTPGIRFEGGDKGDQIRITTPAKAKELGSDYIVVGRPITKASNPLEIYEKCCMDFLD